MRRSPFAPLLALTLVPAALTACAGKFHEEVGDGRVERVEARKGETQAQALHRRGVHCMEELERPDCAIEHFEELLELNPRERELVGDALFRLIGLYDRRDDQENTHRLVRKYWELGTGHRNRSTAPYSAQFLGREMTSAVSFSVSRTMGAPFWEGADPELQEWIMTCDEERREEIERTRKARKDSERQASGQPTPPEGTEPRKDGAEQNEKDKAKKPESDEEDQPGAVYEDLDFCELLGTLGLADQRDLSSWFLASNHFQKEYSAFVLVLDDARAALDVGTTSGTLTKVDDRRFRYGDRKYDGGDVYLVTLDADEIMVLPEAMVEPVMSAYEARKPNLNADLDELLGRVPEDSAFVTVVTRAALEEAFREIPTWLRGAVPIPDGFMVTGVTYEYSGLFMRFDTKSPLKAQMMAGAARYLVGRMLTRSEEEGDDGGALPTTLAENLDIVPSEDGKSVLVAMFMSKSQVVELIDSIAE